MKQCKNTFPLGQSGFSLIELIVYLAILTVLMSAVVISFHGTTYRVFQQSGIAETKIETDVGLELLRSDLEHAGFGLPWQSTTNMNYTEPVPLAGASTDIPRALISEDLSANSHNGADYLVIRATNVIRGVSGQKWGYVGRKIDHTIDVQSMSSDVFENTDRVIVLRPETSNGVYRQLVMDGATYATQPTLAEMATFAPDATPNDPDGERYLVYGVNDASIKRPFNRTDYFISAANVPTLCAPNTGVLVKVTANQANDNLSLPMPIVDCVADFQIIYYRDTNGDGGWDLRSDANGLAGLSAEQIRNQVKAIRCYLLTHEGGKDDHFTYANNAINVGEVDTDGTTLLAGRSFTLDTIIGGNWANYRWKVVSLAVTPKNLK